MNKNNGPGKSSNRNLYVILVVLALLGTAVIFGLGDKIRGQFNGTESSDNEGDIENSPSESILSGADIELKQIASGLNRLSQHTPEDQLKLFQQAAARFSALRQSAPNRQLVDSLYDIYLSRGTSSLAAFEQNGDVNSKRYAVNWYKLGYNLKPSAILEERIERLKVPAAVVAKQEIKPQPKPPKKTKPKKNNDLFILDPELH